MGREKPEKKHTHTTTVSSGRSGAVVVVATAVARGGDDITRGSEVPSSACGIFQLCRDRWRGLSRFWFTFFFPIRSLNAHPPRTSAAAAFASHTHRASSATVGVFVCAPSASVLPLWGFSQSGFLCASVFFKLAVREFVEFFSISIPPLWPIIISTHNHDRQYGKYNIIYLYINLSVLWCFF